MSQNETNRMVARRALEEVWNRGNLDIIATLYAEDFVEHSARSGIIRGSEGLKNLVGPAIVGIAYERLAVEELFSTGDKVAARYVVHGCSSGANVNQLPQWQPASARGALVMRFSRGQIKESWGMARMVDLLYRCE